MKEGERPGEIENARHSFPEEFEECPRVYFTRLVLEDQMNFIKTSVMDGANVEQELTVQLPEASAAKTALEKLQNERETLPIYPYRDQLLQAVNDHQVLVNVGETGSGKTTQIPQYLHEAGYTQRGKIGCTQPQRPAAMSVAGRVSKEMGVKLGHEFCLLLLQYSRLISSNWVIGNLSSLLSKKVCFRLSTNNHSNQIMVGYSIRFEHCTSGKTLLKYMTDEMLLLEFLGEPDLASYCVIMLDEAYERTLSTDVLFGLVKVNSAEGLGTALNENGELTKAGRRMSEFPLDPMLSKMIVASDKYQCSDEIISIAAMLSIGNSIFYCPRDEQVHADNARRNFHMGNVGDHIALLKVYSSWKETNFSTQWRYENYIHVRSMKRATDIRDQLEGLSEGVEMQLTSNLNDLDVIKKAIISGFFPLSARLQKNGSYRTVKHPHTVHIHLSSGLAQALPRWVIYHELVLTTKQYMQQVTELKPEWLVEIAPQYYQLKDEEHRKQSLSM